MSGAALVIHGHFYQPPRENPWTSILDPEPSAAPFANWNERIHTECYRPNAYARIVDNAQRLERLVNNYAHVSFNFGPTLLNWIQAHDPDAYAQILQADRISAARNGGHGNAIAQAYNHAILPLCNERDRITQVRWGLADFQSRFGREAEALWLPETAIDSATLGTLIDHGLRYVILSPFQAQRVRPLDGDEDAWADVSGGSVNTSRAYRCYHPDGSGRHMAVFFYDGAVARSVAFEGGLASSQALVERLRAAVPESGGLVNVATDGESYGHHTHFGDRVLAHGLTVRAPEAGLAVTNYGAFLAANPPAWEVVLQPGPDGEGTAWSCAHGVGRWYRDCGCSTGGEPGWNQAWRTPLRQAFDLLRDAAAVAFEHEGARYFDDPWAVRDAYIELILDRQRSREAFLRRHCGRPLQRMQQVRALTLLEMQHQAQLMYTSCGWFFNDISGIETVQTLRYAARLMDLMSSLGLQPPREAFLAELAQARSNVPDAGTGADIFLRHAEKARMEAPGVAAHLGLTALVDGDAPRGHVANYRYARKQFRRESSGRMTMVTARVQLESLITGRLTDLALVAMHFGGVDFHCVLHDFPGAGAFREASERVWASFARAPLPELLDAAHEAFGTDRYGLQHVLPHGRQAIAETSFARLMSQFTDQLGELFETNRRDIEMLGAAGFRLPEELRIAAEYTLERRFAEEIRRQQRSHEPEAYQRALEIGEEAARLGYRIDRGEASRIFQDMITDAVARATAEQDATFSETAVHLLRLAGRLRLQPDVQRAQELLYSALVHGERPVSPELETLGEALRLSPRLLGTAEASTPGSAQTVA